MNRILSWLCKVSLVPLIKGVFIEKIIGEENIVNLKRNFILASNHQSHLDTLVDGCLCVPRNFHFIGQIDGWRGIPRLFIRGLYLLCGVIPLDRKDKESKRKVIRKTIKVLKKGDILVIYPEGTRSINGKIQKGRFGISKIFLKTGVPIIPAGIKGSFELFPPKGKLRIKKIIKVNIGKPLFFKEEFKKAKNLDENTREYCQILQKITDKVMKEISNLTAIL
ncbi:1-acyl-sn-glycerol-3-phosphate acyltransferase [Patescibacteria group bacterium]|nr:1-acyl-sn-glycerol-3-phosphate acyltransferase [Patescibacteria group bacterium]